MLPTHVPHGHAKAIILGEHAVVYGHDALCTALPLGFAATLDHPPSGPLLAVEVTTPGGPRPERAAAGDGSPLGSALAAIAGALGLVRTRPLLIRVVGDVPPGRGLGSSAALAAVMADALVVAHGLDLVRGEIARAARAGDDLFHGGRASGIDAEAAARRELGLFSRAAGWRKVTPARPLPLLIIDSGAARQTAAVVAEVARRRAADELGVARTMAAIGQLAPAGATAAETGDLAGLGVLMDQNQTLLGELGVSTPGLDAICAAARAAGALGAKLTGAGGGGSAIALFATPAALALAAATFTANRVWKASCP